MAQSNQAVWGVMDHEVRSYKGPPSLAITEHWNYEDRGKDFFGGYCYMSQGPLPQLWANTQMSARGLWGARLMREMENYNHVGRPEDRRRDAAAGSQIASPSPTRSISTGCAFRASPIRGATTTKRLIDHSLKFMTQALQAIDAQGHLDSGRRHLPSQRHGADGR